MIFVLNLRTLGIIKYKTIVKLLREFSHVCVFLKTKAVNKNHSNKSGRDMVNLKKN